MATGSSLSLTSAPVYRSRFAAPVFGKAPKEGCGPFRRGSVHREEQDAARARRQRAADRQASVTVRRVKIGADDTDLQMVRGEAGISLAAQLSRTAWSLTRRPLPQYDRA